MPSPSRSLVISPIEQAWRRFRHRPPLELEYAINLLAFEREEQFWHERAITLYEFQTWTLFPEPRQSEPFSAAQLLAATILRQVEFERLKGKKPPFVGTRDMKRLLQDPEYLDVFENVLGPYGGPTALFETPSPREFEKNCRIRRNRAQCVYPLIHYLVSMRLHHPAEQNLCNISHAVFFDWWVTRNRSATLVPHTLFSWWGKLKRSAAFLFVDKLFDFQMSPACPNSALLDKVIRAADERERMRRFFGLAATAFELLGRENDNENPVVIPAMLPRLPISINPIPSDQIERLAREYPVYYMTMNDKKERADRGREGAQPDTDDV